MLIIDSIILLSLIVGLHILRIKYPNFLFFCKGAILFLPPDQQQRQQKQQKQQKQLKQKNKKNRSQQQQPRIKILQTQYKHVKDYPMSDQYSRIILLISALIIFIPIKYILTKIVSFITSSNTHQHTHTHIQQQSINLSSQFIFIISLVILIYIIKIGLQIFWISSYNIKYCIIIVLSINVVMFMIFLSTVGLGNYDMSIQWAAIDYRKQLSIIVGKNLSDNGLNMRNILIFVLFINVLLTLISIPAIIKFGNWYTKTLKQIYYEDQQTAQLTNAEQKKQRVQKQKILKKKSAKTIRLLNIYLVALLVFLFLSHRYIHQFLQQTLVTILRILLMALITYINCVTLKDAIQFNGSFAYKHIGEYLNSSNEQQKVKIRQKIIPYLYLIWYHKFQFMFRIIVPLLLFIMLIDWKYMHSTKQTLQYSPIISLTHCGVNTNKLQIIQNLYKCDVYTPNTKIHQVSQPFANGMLIAGKKNQDLTLTQERLTKYGLLNRNFMEELMEQIIWYYNITVYAMTVVYILFLRKTVYQI